MALALVGMANAGSVIEHYVDVDFQVKYPGRVQY